MKRWDVEVEIWGHPCSYTVTAKSRSAAKYEVWLYVSDPTGIDFREFLSCIRSVCRSRTVPTRYSYAAEHYGVDVRAGDRVRTVSGAEGIVAEPPGGNDRHSYIFVNCGHGNMPYHPSEVEAL